MTEKKTLNLIDRTNRRGRKRSDANVRVNWLAGAKAPIRYGWDFDKETG